MKHKGFMRAWLVLPLLVALSMSSQAEMSWTYADFTYQRSEEDTVDGFVGSVSSSVSKNWVVQGGVNHLMLDERGVEFSRTRYDLSVGRVFTLGNRLDALLSGGYTKLDFRTEILDMSEDASDDLGNVQLALRGQMGERFEADASIGMLFDDEDTSDALWSVALRYKITNSFAVQLGANGSDDSEASENVMYELGFRFDLAE